MYKLPQDYPQDRGGLNRASVLPLLLFLPAGQQEPQRHWRALESHYPQIKGDYT
jgi:hypothetical protein